MRSSDISPAAWRKSSYSNDGTGGNCVEVAQLSGLVTVRDSKNPDGPLLVFTPAEWSAFLDGIRAGDFG